MKLTRANSLSPMHQWFIHLFEQRMDSEGFVRCFECNKRMHEDTWKMLSTCYSHILSKKIYPEYKGEHWNVKIVHPDCHHIYTMKPSDAKNQYNEYIKLLEKIEKNG